MYRPKGDFNVPMKLLIPTNKKVNGTPVKDYPRPEDVSDDMVFFGSFRTFGGTETNVNGVTVIEDTATVETWYRPDILADARIHLIERDKTYDVIGEPEDIEERHLFMRFKVRCVGGKRNGSS